MNVNDKDTKLDDFEGGLETTSEGSVTSGTSDVGTKTTKNEKSSNSKTSGTSEIDKKTLGTKINSETSVTSGSKTNSRHKTEASEVSEANARKQDPSLSRHKTEHSEVSEVSKNYTSSVTSGSSETTEYTHFKCITCNAGEFGLNEKGTNNKSILEFHKKQGHSIQYLNLKGDDNY